MHFRSCVHLSPCLNCRIYFLSTLMMTSWKNFFGAGIIALLHTSQVQNISKCLNNSHSGSKYFTSFWQKKMKLFYKISLHFRVAIKEQELVLFSCHLFAKLRKFDETNFTAPMAWRRSLNIKPLFSKILCEDAHTASTNVRSFCITREQKCCSFA